MGERGLYLKKDTLNADSKCLLMEVVLNSSGPLLVQRLNPVHSWDVVSPRYSICMGKALF